MKVIQISSLFLYILIAGLWNQNLSSQEVTDSLDYYNKLALNPKKSNDFISAYRFYDQHKKKMWLQQDTLAVIMDLKEMAALQKNFGFFSDSETLAIEALKLLDALKANEATVKARVGLYNHLGMINRAYSNYSEALKYYDKALKAVDNTLDSVNIFNNKANVYIHQKRYELAIKAFTEIYNQQLKFGKEKLQARALHQLGFSQLCSNMSEGEDNLLKALKIREQIEDVRGIYSSCKTLAKYYKEKNKDAKARYYANRAYSKAKLINSPTYIRDALSTLIDLDDNPLVLEYKRLSDSLDLARKLSEYKFASLKYEATEHIRKAHESELQRTKEQNLRVRYQFLGVLIIISSIGLFFVLKFHHNKEKVRQVYNTETRISKKIHDEVANDLFQVMTKLQSKANNREHVLDSLENIYNKTRDISKENNIIDVNGDFSVLLHDLLLSYKSDSVNIMTRHISKVDWDTIEPIKKITVFRVLQELMVNMKKHSMASIVALTFTQFNKKITVSYSDNGIGGKIKKNSGILNMENRIDSINGSITFESEQGKGFKVKIII